MKAIAAFIAALALAFATTLHAETWKFGVIGDIPYSDFERRETPGMLRLIEGGNPALIVHAGDIKLSSAPCTDDLLLDRLALFNSSRVPLLYTPGDNEWTNCSDLAAGHYNEIERLNKVRQLFFAEPRSLGRNTIPVEQQSAETPENQRWQLGPVLFVSLNVPGPNNNYGMRRGPSTEFQARNPLLVDWLQQGFSRARANRSAGIVILMQGNPAFKHFTAGLAHSGFRELLEILRAETLDFPGQVLLIHGDTHWHRVDHPMFHPNSARPIANFTRLETYGYPFMGWVDVTIDPDAPTLFQFESHPYKTKLR